MKELITSRNNKNVTEAAKLRDKKYRDASQLFCFEGRKLFMEAIQSNVDIASVFVTEKSHNDLIIFLDTLSCPIYTVTESVYEKLTFDNSPDGVFCTARKKDATPISGKTFILSSVRDPGNLGTCIRSARAFGVDNLILHDCADEFNPKVIRASMGASFRQHITHTHDIIPQLSRLKSQGYTVYAAALNKQSSSLSELSINEKTVFMVGNEGHGLSDDVIAACDGSVIIPMPGDTESLNASVAASILIWELSKI